MRVHGIGRQPAYWIQPRNHSHGAGRLCHVVPCLRPRVRATCLHARPLSHLRRNMPRPWSAPAATLWSRWRSAG